MAKRVGVAQLVYSGAGPGVKDSGVGSWETKMEVAAYLRTLDLPATILHPTAFMELMTEPKFFPPASVWHLMPKLMDRSTGGMADGRGPGRHRRQGLRRSGPLHRTRSHAASDVQSIAACRAIWREVTGRPPRRFPMPRWLFERFAGTDETTMWRWLGANKVDFDTGPTLTIHPAALTVREWLQRKQARSVRRRQGRTSA